MTDEILSDVAPEASFMLSREQRSNSALLERLLGKVIAERYEDFCRIAAGATDLRVTIPLAGHALRELESSIRTALAVPMGADSVGELKADRVQEIKDAVRSLGLSGQQIAVVLKALTPKSTHAEQITRIVGKLGLATDGEIARAWIKLSRTAEQAHNRSFHRSLQVDDEFRSNFQTPLELVVRGVMLALEGRYSSLMRRVESLAAFPDARQALKLFEAEIPGSLPLQWHFYETLSSPDWLPLLIERKLTRAPQYEQGDAQNFKQWPIGIYLRRMADIRDEVTPVHVVAALKTIAESKHPDVVQLGLQIIASLPCREAASTVDIVKGWLTPDIRYFFMEAPQKIIASLAACGESKAARDMARCVFQLVESDGNIATLHQHHMYEHFLPQTVIALNATDPQASVDLFAEILMSGILIRGTYEVNPPKDYTYITTYPIASNEMTNYEPYYALVAAVRDSAISTAKRAPQNTSEVVAELYARGPKIFKRIALHVLAKNAERSLELCASFLTDPVLIAGDWCQDEYGELAVAAFSFQTASDQNAIFAHIEAEPDQFRSIWAERYQADKGQLPDETAVRRYENAIFRDRVWSWRSALPKPHRDRLDRIVREQGDPDSWKDQFFPTETSPLSDEEFSSAPTVRIVAFLANWKADPNSKKHTIEALSDQLRRSVEKDAKRFALDADKFSSLNFRYIQEILRGIETYFSNTDEIPWLPVLKLIDEIIQRGRSEAVLQNAGLEETGWLRAAMASADLLRKTLAQGARGIPYLFSGEIFAAVCGLLQIAPTTARTNDFEREFEKHPYHSARGTLRGIATEILILYLFWEAKQPGSLTSERIRDALNVRGDVRRELESLLADRSPTSRVPRAILGRWSQWLQHFGEEWLVAQAHAIFPADDENLRLAAWRAHLLSDQGPARSLLPHLLPSYLDEIRRLANEQARAETQNQSEADLRGNRLAEYVAVIYLYESAPTSLMEAFWKDGPPNAKQHAMWFIGRQLGRESDKLSPLARKRCYSYFELRLTAAIAASDKDSFRAELGSISSWCQHAQIDTEWLLDRLLEMLSAGFAPSSGYSVVQWLGTISATVPDRAVEALMALLRNPHLDRWAYATHSESVRTILKVGLASENRDTAATAEATISYLASVGEPKYLELLRQ